MLSTDKAWEKFGKDDPYFGVLAHERFTAGQIGANLSEFFNTGRSAVSQIVERYEAHFGPLPKDRALDHGCGVGRLTLPLAERFEEVIGLDVSPSMIAEATSNAAQAGAANARFALADDQLSCA